MVTGTRKLGIGMLMGKLEIERIIGLKSGAMIGLESGAMIVL